MRTKRIALIVTSAAVPASQAWTTQAAGADHAVSASKVQKFKGPTEDMRWGPVRVTISVKSKKITAVSATAPEERTRSLIINEQALPMLKHEVLQAQSAKIDQISGATMTSQAYIASLQAAVKKAKEHKALK